jgi:hypothetical protein
VEPAVDSPVLREARERPGMSASAPADCRVIQIASHPEHDSAHISTEAQFMTPDGNRFVFWRFPE